MTRQEREALRMLVNDATREMLADKDRRLQQAEKTAAAVDERKWERDLCIIAVKMFAAVEGRPPTSRQWKGAATAAEPPRPTVRVIQNLFGSWNNLIVEAGFEPGITATHRNQHGPVVVYQTESQRTAARRRSWRNTKRRLRQRQLGREEQSRKIVAAYKRSQREEAA